MKISNWLFISFKSIEYFWGMKQARTTRQSGNGEKNDISAENEIKKKFHSFFVLAFAAVAEMSRKAEKEEAKNRKKKTLLVCGVAMEISSLAKSLNSEQSSSEFSDESEIDF